MYQKTRFSHKYLIISIDIDFLRFCFPFFYIHWLMGYNYANGANGLKADYELAYQWFKKASNNGFAAAAYYLGWMYYYGEGVNQDVSEALNWFTKSYELGMPEAKKWMAYCQKDVKAFYSKSQKDSFNPSRPPIIEIVDNSVKFVDPNGNNAIDAGEKCYISFSIINKGEGEANNCVANILSADIIKGLLLNSVNIPYIASGEKKNIKIPIEADLNLGNGKIDLILQVNESHGFGSDPIQLSVATKQFAAPKLEIVDYAITSASGSNTLKKKEPFDIQLLLQNLKYGNAEDIIVDFIVPKGVIIMDEETRKHYANLSGGATKSIEYSLIVSNDYKDNSIPLDINVRERYGKYGQKKHIDLKLNQSMATNKIIVEENNLEEIKNFDIKTASLKSDVDKDIPIVNSSKNENTFAVIIANETYRKEAGVPFASNDGKVFAEYCEKTLCIPTSNIHLVVNATLNDMKHEIGWLNKVLETRKGEAKAILYYAGHGIPDEKQLQAYLLPVDGYGNDISTGYPLSLLYKELGNIPSKSVSIFLDACFSGAKREGDMLASSRGVALKVNRGEPCGNTVVFSASQGDETAYPYKNEGHGLFTYYLLKILKETKGEATLKQIGDFVSEKVSQQSIVINNKPQTPTVILSKDLSINWENQKLKK